MPRYRLACVRSSQALTLANAPKHQQRARQSKTVSCRGPIPSPAPRQAHLPLQIMLRLPNICSRLHQHPLHPRSAPRQTHISLVIMSRLPNIYSSLHRHSRHPQPAPRQHQFFHVMLRLMQCCIHHVHLLLALLGAEVGDWKSQHMMLTSRYYRTCYTCPRPC